MQKIVRSLAFLVCFGLAQQALAQGVVHPGGFPDPVSPTGAIISDTYNFVFWITALIAILVEVIILACIWKFRRSRNPEPAKFSHNTVLEIIWTAIPVVICVAIAVKSYAAMNVLRSQPENGITVEAIAYQFGWDFEYPDLQIVAPEAEQPHATLSSAGQNRFVKELVVPVNTNVKVQVVAKDVLHAFYVPALGVKIDAVPGRINTAWFNATKEGEYIGQCAELCGVAHGEMFFSVRAVSKQDYLVWLNSQRALNGLEALTMADLDKVAG